MTSNLSRLLAVLLLATTCLCGSLFADQIFDFLRKAAEQGDASAQYMLGNAYYQGEGVAKNAVEAYAWINLAAITDEFAKEKRADLEKTMTAQQIADGQKRSTELSALIKKK